MKDRFVWALALIVAVLGGVFIGFALGNGYRGQPAGRIHSERADTTDESLLQGYVALLDNLSVHDASDATRQIHAADKALLLIRLADLAEQRGSSAESTRLTADALAVCATRGLSYCSSVELRQRAQQLDAALDSIKRAR